METGRASGGHDLWDQMFKLLFEDGFLTDENYFSYIVEGHLVTISVRLFTILTTGFRREVF